MYIFDNIKKTLSIHEKPFWVLYDLKSSSSPMAATGSNRFPSALLMNPTIILYFQKLGQIFKIEIRLT